METRQLGVGDVDWGNFVFELEMQLSRSGLTGKEQEKALARAALRLVKQPGTVEEAEAFAAGLDEFEAHDMIQRDALEYLYLVLVNMCGGSAKELLKRQGDGNGLAAFRQLGKRFGRQDLCSLYSAVFGFRWVEVDSAEAFEQLWVRFVTAVEALPADSLPVDGLRSLVLNGLAQSGPRFEALRRHVQLTEYDSWVKLCARVQEYTKVELELHAEAEVVVLSGDFQG